MKAAGMSDILLKAGLRLQRQIERYSQYGEYWTVQPEGYFTSYMIYP